MQLLDALIYTKINTFLVRKSIDFPHTHTHTHTYIYIYIYIYILKTTDRLFRCITTHQCGYIRKRLKPSWLYVSKIYLPRSIVILSVSEIFFTYIYIYIYICVCVCVCVCLCKKNLIYIYILGRLDPCCIAWGKQPGLFASTGTQIRQNSCVSINESHTQFKRQAYWYW